MTASKTIILCRGLQRVTAKLQRDGTLTTEKVKEMVALLSASMEKRFHRMEYNVLLSETSILDPRFKKLAFNAQGAVDEAVNRLITAAARHDPSNEPSVLIPLPLEEEEAIALIEEESPSPTVWTFFDERATADKGKGNPTADATVEVRSYLEQARIPRNMDPLSWWKEKSCIYPRLTNVMTRRLCVVATSVPSERIFSKSGQILSERRNRLNPSKLRQLVFLNANLE